MKVLAAMSGGVDSSVAAARALAAGHEVVGIHLALSSNPLTLRTGSRGCCSLEDSADARRVADKLGIPFYVWDMSEQFQEAVIDDFVDSYARGETPNPCMRCNQRIKFSALTDKAVSLGYEAIVTGHYARLTDGKLRRAIDSKKDQSYVLSVLSPDRLARAMFPIGDTPKPEIRQEAEQLGLRVANKPDSYDICFIPSGNTKVFLGQKLGIRPGKIVDNVTKEELATHAGIHEFTIGQRKGLGILGPAAHGQPRYVTAIDATTNTVEVGIRATLDAKYIEAREAIILAAEFAGKTIHCQVQVRAHGGVVPAKVQINSDRLLINLTTPLQAVAKGQTVVVYLPDEKAGDLVVASGTIDLVAS